MRIVLIDDDFQLLNFLKSFLEEAGAEVIDARNGAEGIIKAIKYKPDLIITDFQMPQMDGFEVIKSLKSKKLTEKIPIFLISGTDNRLIGEEAKKLGAEKIFTKEPFFEKELVKTIKQIFPIKK